MNSTQAASSESKLGQSSVGEQWRNYLQHDQLSWCSPEQVSSDYFRYYANSEWIQKILQNTALPVSATTRILEAGCGTATFGISLATLGFSVEAFDYNEEALNFARQLLTKAQKNAPTLNVPLYRDNLLQIKQATDSYHLVFNQAVVEYFTEASERQQVLREMMRVTRPGGWVVVISQNCGHPFAKWWQKTGYPGYTDGPAMHIYTAAALGQELTQIGLRSVVTDGIRPWSALFLWPKWYKQWRLTELAMYYLGRVLEYVPLPQYVRRIWAPQVIAIGQKP